MKLLEACKTRTKKTSPNMLNFYVILAGHDKVSETGRATTCRRKFKAPSLQKKAQKMKVLPKTWVLRGKTFEDFRQEKNRNTILDLPKNPFGTQRPCTSQLNKALVNSKIYPKQNQKKPSDQNCWIFAN